MTALKIERTNIVKPRKKRQKNTKKSIIKDTPVEVAKHREDIVINGMRWVEVPGCKYKHDYRAIWQAIQLSNSKDYELGVYRELMMDDLWFLVYFGLRVPIANHPFWVDRCNEVQDGPTNNTLDLWAREHGKSTILTIANLVRETIIDKIRLDIDSSALIMSYSKDAATKFLRSIKYWLETSDFLKACYPDVLWQDPVKESPKWSETEGLYLIRKGNFKEPTFDASGLMAGMQTGGHYRRRVYDDVETQDVANNPDQIEKLKECFDLSENLGTDGGFERVTGTYYSHNGLLTYLENKLDPVTKLPIYHVRKHAATIDGTFGGKSIYMSEERLNKLRANRKTFATQQLLNPTPQGDKKLSSELLLEVDPSEIPKKLYRFMSIDWAGVHKRESKRQDSWGIMLIGVVPYRGEDGLSDIYILDARIEEYDLPTAIKTVVGMYAGGGRILKLGVEKVGASTMDLHIANALRDKGIHCTLDNGRMVELKPGGRGKEFRIENALSYPLLNGKIKISKSINVGTRERLKLEMDKFPFWHDDGLDALSYIYDLIKDFRFPSFHDSSSEESCENPFAKYDRKRARENSLKGKGWMVA